MRQPGVIVPAQRPEPEAGPDEVLLETQSVSICSTDVSYFRGHLVSSEWPIVPGHEYVGRALEVGSRVDGVKPGDRLVYWGQSDFGGLAEYRAIRPLLPNQDGETSWYTERNFYDADQAAAVVVPEHVSSRTATVAEPLTSVLRCLLVNPPQPGDVCAVLGCGPSALLAVQVLKHHMGAGQVIALDKKDDRLRAALRMGADRTFNTVSQAAELEDFAARHHDQFADYLVDALPHVAYDGAGKDVRALGMGLLRPGGSYVIYGATEVPQSLNTWMMLAKGLRVQATPFDVRAFPMSRSAHVLRTAMSMIASGAIAADDVLSQTVSLYDSDGVQNAFSDYGAEGSLKTSFTASAEQSATEAVTRAAVTA